MEEMNEKKCLKNDRRDRRVRRNGKGRSFCMSRAPVKNGRFIL